MKPFSRQSQSWLLSLLPAMFWLGLSAAFPAIVLAQSDWASVRGTVMTSNGTVPPDTMVAVYNSSGKLLKRSPARYGSYRIENLMAGMYTLVATGSGYQPNRKQRNLGKGDNNTVDFYLQRSGQDSVSLFNFKGTLEDPDGRPIPNTRVLLYDPGRDDRKVAQVTTDAEGNFEIPKMPNGHFYLFAVRPDGSANNSGNDILTIPKAVFVDTKPGQTVRLQLQLGSTLTLSASDSPDLRIIPRYYASETPVTAEASMPSKAEEALFKTAQNLFNLGRYDEAVAILETFLKLYPDSSIKDLTLLWLGRSYLRLKQLSKAERVLDSLRAIENTPFLQIYNDELMADYKGDLVAATSGSAESSAVPSMMSTATPTATPSATPRPSAVATSSATQPAPNAGTAPSQSILRQMGALNNRPGYLGRTMPPSLNTTRRKSTGVSRSSAVPAASIGDNRARSSSDIVPRFTRPPLYTVKTANAEETRGLGLSLTVKQVPNLLLALRRPSETASPGQPVQLPLTVQNTGNKEDQFRLETDLPAEFQPSFSLAQGGGDTGLPILVTPTLARGASVDVILNLRIPETATDGQQRTFFVRAASQADYQILKVADGSINVVAAALGANSAASQSSVMPGDTFTQTITVRNQGSAPARGTRADFVFNPNFELVSANPSPITYERASRTAIWSLGDVGARDSRDISVVLRAVPNALAATSSLGRGAVRTQSLPLGSNFDSPSITVGKVPRARIDAVSIGLTATPGDNIYIPFVVRNPGNSRDAYDLLITAPNAPNATIYADTNGDGQHQDSEPVVTQTAALDPQGGQFPMLLRVAIPGNTPDGQQYSYSIVARSQLSNRAASEANTVLRVATPRVRVRTEFASDAPAPGETIFYRLVLVNEGSGLAKNLVVSELLPDALEFVSSDPSLNAQDAPGSGQRFTWRVPELAPGDTTVLRIAVRLRQNLQADTNLRTSHSLTYQDTNGNGYTGQ